MTGGNKIRTFFCLTILTLIFTMPTFALDLDEDIDWDNQSPSEIHKKMWEMKSQAYKQAAVYRQLAAEEKLLNTQLNYDVLFYDVNIRVNDTNEVLYGVVKFVAEAAEDGVNVIQVDYYYNMSIDSIVAPSGNLSYTRSGNVVTVTLDQIYNTGEQFEFEFYYYGHPTEGGFQAFSFDWRLGKRAISSLSEPYFARTWWPCKDRMDDKPDSMNIAITVDTSLYCASNGTLDSTVQFGANAQTFYYRVRYPITTYLFSVAISNYTVWNDEWVYNDGLDTMLLVHAVYPDRYVYSLSRYGLTPQILTILSDAFGMYPYPDEKYGHANFEWGGGMEHQTITSMSGGSFGFSTPVVVHEAAHQWWGDMITCDSWGHIWLNEGWASYAEAIYEEGLGGWPAYHDYMGQMRFTNGGSIYIADTTNVWNIFGSIVYDKGAWVVHMLRGVLGDELFFQGVEAYYNSEYRYKSATTEQFRDIFENVSGVELDWFFEEWIYGTYYPKYSYSYWQEPSEDSGFDIYLYVRQYQTSQPLVFTMPVDLSFNYLGGTNDTMTVEINQREQLIKLNVSPEVLSIDFDPNEWVLRTVSTESWGVHIITYDEDLSDGVQFENYADTIDARGYGSGFIYSFRNGNLPDGITFNSNGTLTGASTETGSFTFTVRVTEMGTSKIDDATYTISFSEYIGIPGDIDISGEINISDLTTLVEYLFNHGAEPPVLHLADIDGSCEINISDLTALVDYLFNNGPPPQVGCAK